MKTTPNQDTQEIQSHLQSLLAAIVQSSVDCGLLHFTKPNIKILIN